MDLLWQAAGWGVVLAVGARATFEVISAVRRRRLDESQRRAALQVFSERARLELAAARAESARRQQTWGGWRKFEVRERVDEALDTVSLYLEPHDRLPVASFLPGQHLKLRLRIPGAERPVVRCYSLSDGPEDPGRYRITVKKVRPRDPEQPPGLASSFLVDRVQVGDLLDVGAPSGHFHLDPQSRRPLVLIGGGVGITPLLSMLNHLDADHWARDVFVFYGARNRHQHPMKDRLEELAAKHEKLRLVTVYSEPTGECRRGIDFQVDGRVDGALLARHLPTRDFEYYLCGPAAMMADLGAALAGWGVPRSDVHFEAFGPSSVPQRQPAGPDAAEVEVVFVRSGRTLTWRGAGTLLELALAHQVAMDSGCAAGSCGSCLTAIKEGEVRYLAEPGEVPAAGSCLPCVCVPAGRLVLDA